MKNRYEDFTQSLNEAEFGEEQFKVGDRVQLKDSVDYDKNVGNVAEVTNDGKYYVEFDSGTDSGYFSADELIALPNKVEPQETKMGPLFNEPEVQI